MQLRWGVRGTNPFSWSPSVFLHLRQFPAILAEGGGVIPAQGAETCLGKIQLFRGQMGHDPSTSQWTWGDGSHLEDPSDELPFHHPGGEHGNAEVEQDHFLDRSDAPDLHGGDGFHVVFLKIPADEPSTGAAAFVEDQGLGLDIRTAQGGRACPWMIA